MRADGVSSITASAMVILLVYYWTIRSTGEMLWFHGDGDGKKKLQVTVSVKNVRCLCASRYDRYVPLHVYARAVWENGIEF